MHIFQVTDQHRQFSYRELAGIIFAKEELRLLPHGFVAQQGEMGIFL